MLQRKILSSSEKYGFVEENFSRCCSMHGFRFCPAGVGGSLVDRPVYKNFEECGMAASDEHHKRSS